MINVCLPTRSQSKVTNSRVPSNVNENVVWLQVPMDDTQSVDMGKSFQDLSKQSPALVYPEVKIVS